MDNTDKKLVRDLLKTKYVDEITSGNSNIKEIFIKYIDNLYENETDEEELKNTVLKEIAEAKKSNDDQEEEKTQAQAVAPVAEETEENENAEAEEKKNEEETSGGSDPASNNINTMVDLLSADTKIVKEIENLSSKLTDRKNKNILNSLKTTLFEHQKTILNRSKNGDQFPTKLLKLINSKIETLNNIAKKQQGGSISTNNSIRRQIFTDLKYITKYLKYKTKYMILKSKH